jgi:hypothetical protein
VDRVRHLDERRVGESRRNGLDPALVAAVIHAIAIPEHLREYALFGWFFAVLAMALPATAADTRHAATSPRPTASPCSMPVAASIACPTVWPRLSSARWPVSSRSSRPTIAALYAIDRSITVRSSGGGGVAAGLQNTG